MYNILGLTPRVSFSRPEEQTRNLRFTKSLQVVTMKVDHGPHLVNQ